MADKGINIILPEELVQKATACSSELKITLAQCIEQALEQYISLYHKLELRECMKTGYQEMADLNLDLVQ